MAHEEPLGRGRELERIDQFLNATASHPTALTITGPAGIGKTTVWREACRRATAMGYRVLRTEPTESEARFSFAGLGDLFADLEASELDALPGVQRRVRASMVSRLGAPVRLFYWGIP